MQAVAATVIHRSAEDAVGRHPRGTAPAKHACPPPERHTPQRQIDVSPLVLAQKRQIDSIFGTPAQRLGRRATASPPASTGTGGPVVQRETFTLSRQQLVDLRLVGDRKKLFSEFLKVNNYEYEAKTRVANTGANGPTTFEEFQKAFENYVGQNQQIELEPEELAERITTAGRQVVSTRYQGCDIKTLVKEGKNNRGIYRIKTEKGELVVKVLSAGIPTASEAMKRVPALQKRFSPLERGDKIDITTPIDFEVIEEDQFSFGLATYKAHGVMSLNTALELQDLPVEALAASARGLGSRIAAFHFAPIERGDEKDGSYLVHGDLNASNLMLDMDGIVGLVDVDRVELGTLDKVEWDLSSLLGSLKTVLEMRYEAQAAQEVFKAMKVGFAQGYKNRMASNSVKSVPESIRTRLSILLDK